MYIGPKSGKISYKNISNLDDEILRILNKAKYSDLKTYFTYLGLQNSDIAKEFLTINGIVPNMLKTKRILMYSALLNYNWSIVTLELDTETHRRFLDILESLDLIDTNVSEESWSNLCRLFSDFLDQLMARTIHYTD